MAGGVRTHAAGVLCFSVIKPMRESEMEGRKYRKMAKCIQKVRSGGWGAKRTER